MTKRISTTVLERIYRNFFNGWPWFAVTACLALVIATIYVHKVRPIYELKASLLIVNEKSNSSEQTALKEIDVANKPKQIETELQVFRSREMVKEVLLKQKLISQGED